MPPFHGSIPRVHFIAFLDKKSDEYNETSNAIGITDSLNIVGEKSNTSSDTVFSSSLSSLLVSLPVNIFCFICCWNNAGKPN